MDSVSQKNNFLSMTGIDQTEENTEAISDISKQTEKNTTDISGITNTLTNFIQNDIPFFVRMNNLNQTTNINGFIPIKYTTMGYETFDKFIFNPAVGSADGRTKTAAGKGYQMIFDVNTGLDVKAPITILDNSLTISKISGLQDALNNSAVIADRSITGKKIALNTILEENVANLAITTYKIAYNTILGANLNSAISISTSGRIDASAGTFTTFNTSVCYATNLNANNYWISNAERLLTFQIHGCKDSKVVDGALIFSPCSNFVDNRLRNYAVPCNLVITKATLMFDDDTGTQYVGQMTFDFYSKTKNSGNLTNIGSETIDYTTKECTTGSDTQLITFVKPITIPMGNILNIAYSGSPDNEWGIVFHAYQY